MLQLSAYLFPVTKLEMRLCGSHYSAEWRIKSACVVLSDKNFSLAFQLGPDESHDIFYGIVV